MNSSGKIQRQILPLPDRQHVGLTTYDAKDPETKFPPIRDIRPPAEAPNVLIVLIDDAGFGSSSAFAVPARLPLSRSWRQTGFDTTVFIPRRCAHRRGKRC